MKLVFYKDIELLQGRIIIEFINAYTEKCKPAFDDKVCFSGVTHSKIDDKNSKVSFYVQAIISGQDTTDLYKNKWFVFEMQYGNDFSCANIYLRELQENPHIRNRAEKWFKDNYDEGGGYEKADMVEAYLQGFQSKHIVTKK